MGRSQSSAANEEEVALLLRHPRYEFSAAAFKQYQSSLLLAWILMSVSDIRGSYNIQGDSTQV